MHYLSVAACFKNEHHCIVEWIEHYKLHGVDHIYLINDFSTPEYIPLVQRYIDDNYITLFHNDIIKKSFGRQDDIYNKYLTSVLTETEWMAIIDMDEFLYSPKELNLKNIISKYKDYSAVEVEWIHFGSNGHITQPKSLVQGFTMRAKRDHKNVDFYSYKTIFKTSTLVSFGVHNSAVNGARIRLDSYNDD